jgi:HK97 family phage major capsid protein
MQTLQVEKNSGLSQFGQESIKKVGRIVIESLKKDHPEKYEALREAVAKKAGVAKESIDVTETDLFVTAISSFVEKRLKPKLIAEGVIKKITNFDTKGQNAVKLPMRNALCTAQDLPDDGAVSYDTGSYTSTTVTLTYKYAAQRLTHEIMKFANVDLISEELSEIGDAIRRKYDTDIIAAVKAASVTAQGNFAYTSGTYVAFTDIVAARKSALANYAEPDVIVVSPETEATIYNLAQFSGTSTVGAMHYQGKDGEYFPTARSILGMRVIVTPQVADTDIYLIDTARCGYAVEAGSVETFDGRVSGALAYEVIGALNYGVGIVQPKAIYRVEEKA